MLTDSPFKGAIFLSIFLLTTATGLGASLDLGDNVWDTDEGLDHVEGTATCTSPTDSTEELREASDTNNTIDLSSENVTRGDIVDGDDGLGLGAGEQTLELYCGDGSGANNTTTADVTVREATFEVTDHGSGFIGEKMGNSIGSSPLQLTVDVNDVIKSQLSKDQFSFRFSSIDGKIDKNNVYDWRLTDAGDLIIRPTITDYRPTDDLLRVHLNMTVDGDTISLGSASFEPQTFAYSYDIKDRQVKPKIAFHKVLEKNYLYDLSINRQTNSVNDIQGRNLSLTIKKVDGGTLDPDKFEDQYEWIKLYYPDEEESFNGKHVLRLPREPDIPEGRFDFIVEILRPNGDIVIDKFRVINEPHVEGMVKDGNGNGLSTNIQLRYSDNTLQRIETLSDGKYSLPLSKDVETSVWTFPGIEDYEGSLTVTNPDFKTKMGESDLDAVKFQHNDGNPAISEPGLNAISKAGVKFGYNVEGGVNLNMKIDPAGVDTRDLQVYECTNWDVYNFECMGSWSKISENDWTYDTGNTRVQIKDISLLESGNDEIVKNGYAVGVPAQLLLDGSMTLNSQRLSSGSSLEVTGNVESTRNGGVDDATVELELDGEDASKTLTTETNSDGQFTVEGEVPDAPGEYTLDARLRKDPFVSNQISSDKTIEVYYETGMLIDSSGFGQIRMGNESRLTFQVENDGQAPIDISDISVQGLNGHTTLVDRPNEIGAGEEEEVEVLVDLPSDFCSYPCNKQTELDISVEGESAGTQLSAESPIRFSFEQPEQTTSTNQTEANESQQEASFGGPTARMVEMTSRMTQNDMNVALGLILVFTVVLAAAIKRKKAQDGGARGQQDERGNGGRPQIQPRENKIARPRVKSSTAPDDETIEAEADTEETDEDTTDEQQDGEYVCEATGETFDTKAALEMYRKMNDIDE